MKTKTHKVALGGGFSCLVCGQGSYPGYSRANPKRALPCPNCGYDAPAEMSHAAFHKFIKWRDKLGGTPNRSMHLRFATALSCYPLFFAPFKTLALGTKFSYVEHPGQVWVKIAHNTIAKWDREQVATSWVGQTICSAATDDKDFRVILRETD